MQKIRKITLLILNILLLNSLFINCYATAITVTKENLNASLQEFVSSGANENNYKITVSDNIITIAVDGKSYTLNYNLAEKPKFTLEIPIEKGMSYKDFKAQTDNLILPMIGYIAVAKIQGVEFEDANAYFFMSYLGNAFNGSWSSENSYVIIDDTNMSDGVTIDRDESDTKTIYASEFGEKVMEYVNATYKDKQTIADTTSGINSYELVTERKDVTETSCKLVSSLTVNVDADFSKIKGYANQIGESFLNKDITKDNADYSIELKVGQKCRFEATEKITGHEISGSGYDYKEVNENCVEITGTRVGKANGYIYVGETKKSFYITVEENTENKTLDTITLKINTTTTNNKPSENDSAGQQQEQTQKPQTAQQTSSTSKDNTISKSTLPKTGVSNAIYIIMTFNFILLVIFGIKMKKYKDIK